MWLKYKSIFVLLIYFEDKRSIELDKSSTNLGINQFLLENIHSPEGKRILFELSCQHFDR